MTPLRLDKWLSHALGLSRAEARARIRSGEVSLRGEITRDPAAHADPERDDAALNGVPFAAPAPIHLMMNKRAGLLTAARDSRQPTVLDDLPPLAARRGAMPVGRLDKDTTGLLIFTTDGTLAHRLLAPARDVSKRYLAQVDGPLDACDIAAFAEGLTLSDFTALPAALEIVRSGDAESVARVTVREGKFHQIKRMFLARGRTVTALRRLEMGGVALDARLAEGETRPLSDAEIGALYAAAGLIDESSPRPPRNESKGAAP